MSQDSVGPRTVPTLLLAGLLMLAPRAHAAPAADTRGHVPGHVAAQLHFDTAGHARFPFEFGGQHIWVRGRVNGADSVWIVIDTGASSSILDQSVSSHLGLKTAGELHSLGLGGAQNSLLVKDVTIELPGFSIHRPTIGCIDMSAINRQAGRPMDVVVGYELFRDCVVRIDFPGRMVDVWDPSAAPTDLPGVEVPMTLIQNLPYVDGVLDLAGRDPVRGKFVLDTGSGSSLFMAADVSRRERLAEAFPRTLVSIARGVGGTVQNRVGRAESFAIGSLVFVKPTVVVPDSGDAHPSVSGSVGNLGGQLIGRCRVTFDYARQRIRFEPGPDFDQPFETDMSGLVTTRTPEGMAVLLVNDDTPASEAGLHSGDVITGIDGEPAPAFEPTALRQRLQQPGRTVRLDVRRGEASLTATLTLRRLI